MVLRLLSSILFGLLLTMKSGPVQSAGWDDYIVTKGVVAKYSAKEKFYEPEKDGDLGGNCNDFTAMVGNGGFGTEMDRALADIAGKIVFWSNETTALGYPSSISKDLISQVERNLVSNLLDGHYQKSYNRYDIDFESAAKPLIVAGDNYREHNNPRLKRLHWVPTGCGAGGETEVTFKSSPPGGQISIIPEFNYELCMARGDTSVSGSCRTAWRRIESSGAGEAASVYYVYVKWPGKTSGPTRYDLSRAKDGQKVVVGD